MGERGQVFTAAKYAVIVRGHDGWPERGHDGWPVRAHDGWPERARARTRGCGRRLRRAGVGGVGVDSEGVESNEARLAAASSDAADPVLELGHPGVNAWSVGQGAAYSKAHNPKLDPDHIAASGHHWATRVPLWR